ncbi:MULTISPECIES: hypothetical protein [unclassified Enterococcus]|uniref:hypothetical protein n=1 Tax=unclassified Enterococcus TaxID=2608891 RepID=UPI00190716D7|nr:MULTISPECIES: hypothetical protein [unclassified Enterococcus]MBK0038349.1 hypothetical protein [Enterococcus sp. S52]MBK0070981.1 hypothetical protein [Enterococcus sp. S53]MBK0141506.1 hypothetical protein [Enterococcus sp. S76]MBK0144919.1 hypothetical protein [Enterococcus sp. S77]
MNEPDYCERCNLYTMVKQDPEPDETECVWYCPVCDQFEVVADSAIVSKTLIGGTLTWEKQNPK